MRRIWERGHWVRAKGNSPVNDAFASRVNPGAFCEPNPLDPSYGGNKRDSNTRATGLPFPACAQMHGNA